MEQLKVKLYNFMGYFFIFFAVVGLLSGDLVQAFVFFCVGVLFSSKIKEWVYKKVDIQVTLVNGVCFAIFGAIVLQAVLISSGSVKKPKHYQASQNTVPSAPVTIPPYTIVSETKTQDPNHYDEWAADALVPSLWLETPINERCQIANAIKIKEQLDWVLLCSSEGGCRVPYSESFKRENPQFVADYVGVLDKKGYFSDGNFESVSNNCTEFSAVTDIEGLFPAAVETPSIDAFISENKQFGNIILREKISDWSKGERYRINTYYEKDGLHVLRFIFYLENGEVVTVYQDIPHDGGTERTEIYRKSSE